jgi:NitT/TauT family transport system substrate-binding protein
MSTIARRRTGARHLAPLLLAALALGACGDDGESSSTTPVTAGADATPDSSPDTTPSALEGSMRLGYFPNVTHAPALVGVAQGTFAEALGDGVDLETFTFNAGTEAVEALLSESLDITFIGPNPAINAFAKSNGEAIRIISGSTSGGAYLVVRPGITSVEQLADKTLATPSLGNTQDVALRAWLKENGFETTPEGGGEVKILPQSNSTTLESFISGDIDGAWVPEPWATRLIEEGGGVVLVDERDLWPATAGEYVTTHLIVRTDFLNDHPDLVKAVLVGAADAIDLIAADSAAAQADVVAQIGEITGTEPNPDTIAASFANLTFTLDPIAASLQKSADDAVAVGLLEPVELDGIYDLTLLNEVLAARGAPEVSGL